MEILKKYYHFIFPSIVLIVYLFTLAPTVIQIDSGELSAVQASAGIAHPTGYPLFTITGYLFSLLPLPGPVIYRLNLLAALWCAAGILFFIQIAKLILDNPDSFKSAARALKKNASKGKKKEAVNIKSSEEKTNTGSERVILTTIAAIGAGAFILAFSKTYWFQSTSVEVYSLQVFLFLLILYFSLKAYLKQGDDKKNWLIFSAVLALGFSNHMTTLLLLPATAYLFFVKHRFNKGAFRKIGIMLALFFPVLILMYSYLPIRASQNPIINWGNPEDFESIYRHITGKQYQVWLFSSTAAAKKQLAYFFTFLFEEFNISLFICAAGMVSLFSAARKAFYLLLIIFLSTVLYSINYDIADIDSYFLLAYISLSFFAVFGAAKLFQLLKVKNYNYAISSGLIGIFILLQFYFNLNKVNQSGNYIFEDYTKGVLNSTSKNSLVFSYQWDYFISASYYFQHIENFRKDAAVVDKELLRRSWYFSQLENTSPGILDGVRENKNMFLNALEPFEKDENFNPTLLENLYQRLMTGLVETNITKRDVYIGPELFENEMQQGQFKLPEGYTMVPDLFLFKVVKGNSYVPAADPDFTIRIPRNGNHYTNFIQNYVGTMLVRRALYEMQFDKVDKAKMYIQKIKSDLPGYVIPQGIGDVLKR